MKSLVVDGHDGTLVTFTKDAGNDGYTIGKKGEVGKC